MSEEFVRLGDLGENNSDKMRKLKLSYNKVQQYIPYNTSELNAIIERLWRILMEIATAMLLLSSDLPCSYWEYAIPCSAYIYNRIPPVRQTVGLDKLWTSPEEDFYGLGS